jgi:hypothetical protein
MTRLLVWTLRRFLPRLHVIRETSYWAPAEVVDIRPGTDARIYLVIRQHSLDRPGGGHGSELRGEDAGASLNHVMEERDGH